MSNGSKCYFKCHRTYISKRLQKMIIFIATTLTEKSSITDAISINKKIKCTSVVNKFGVNKSLLQ